MTQAPPLKHRTDIDGLRAIAVLPVVLFHAGFSVFGGGYVGVDIFFVISGYLITSIIDEDIRQSRFSVLRFYARRVRRIFPALAAVILATAVAGAFVLIPDDLSSLGSSIAATALFVSNILFWHESGYFDTAAEFKPLLHTWSLAVEEQFYLFFPWLLIGLARLRWNMKFAVWILLFVSLAASIYGVRHDTTTTFYLLHTRAWELLAGAVIALDAVPKLHSQAVREGLAALGLALIAIAVFAFDRATPFPGESAVLPVLGAALIIHAGLDGGTTFVSRLLRCRVLVWIGLISYSIYLWHWPIIVYLRYYGSVDLDLAQKITAVAASSLAAAFTWRFIEQPFRSARTFGDGKAVRWGAAATATMACLGAVTFAGAADDRFIRYAYGAKLADVRLLSQQTASRDDCVNLTFADLRARHCLIGDDAAHPTIALVGDSFADALSVPVADALKDDGLSIAPYIYYSCPSILETSRDEALHWAPGFVRDCRRYVERSISEIAANPDIRFVIVSNNYDWYLNHASTINAEPILVADRTSADAADNAALLRDKIAKTVTVLLDAGKTVIFVGTSPSGHTRYGGDEVMKAMLHGDLTVDALLPADECRDSTAFLASRADSRRFFYLDLSPYFRREENGRTGCAMTRDQLPLTTDGSHLTSLVSSKVAETIRDIVVRSPTAALTGNSAQ